MLPLNSIAQGAAYWNICGRRRLCHQHYLPLRSRLHDRAMRLRSIGKREFPAYDGLSELFSNQRRSTNGRTQFGLVGVEKHHAQNFRVARHQLARFDFRFFPLLPITTMRPRIASISRSSQDLHSQHFQDYVGP